jgi:hypothetical protein
MGLLRKVSTWHGNSIIPIIRGPQGCARLTVLYGNFGQERDTNSSNDLQSARPSTLPRLGLQCTNDLSGGLRSFSPNSSSGQLSGALIFGYPGANNGQLSKQQIVSMCYDTCTCVRLHGMFFVLFMLPEV